MGPEPIVIMEQHGAPINRVKVHPSESHLFSAIYKGYFTPFITSRFPRCNVGYIYIYCIYNLLESIVHPTRMDISYISPISYLRFYFVHPVLGTSAPQAFRKRRQAMVPRRGTMAMITALLGGSFQDGCKW